MLICKGDKSYKCSKIKTNITGKIFCIRFSTFEPISQTDIANLFEDNTFYFYDDVLQGVLLDTGNTRMVGLRIDYNADSTCKIKIKLLKGDVSHES